MQDRSLFGWELFLQPLFALFGCFFSMVRILAFIAFTRFDFHALKLLDRLAAFFTKNAA